MSGDGPAVHDGPVTACRHIALVLYATRDGQSRRIATRIVDRLGERRIAAAARDLGAGAPSPAELAAVSLVVLVAAVRYGRHLPEARRFLAFCQGLARPPALALVSVNLTARKPAKGTADGNPYLRKLIVESGRRPLLATAVAGRLDYPRYGWLDRQMIRCIMWLTGGPTDPGACIEFTSWTEVDAFAARLAQLHSRQSGAPAPRRGGAGQCGGTEIHTRVVSPLNDVSALDFAASWSSNSS